MYIKIDFLCIGVMIIEFSNSSHKVVVSNSYMNGDQLQPFLTNLFYLKYSFDKNDNGYFPYEYTSYWGDDFERYKIVVSCSRTQANIVIEVFEVSSNDNGVMNILLFSDSCHLSELLTLLMTSFDNIIKEYGLIGYNRVWEVGNFPIAEYLIIKAQSLNYKLNPIYREDIDDEWKNKIDFNDEIALLTR